jgi:flagellar hook-associated protein 1
VSNLLASLQSGAQALLTLDRSVSTVQNNVNNASTPGYARQESHLEALPFDPAHGLFGSVQSGSLVSSRNRFAEQSVCSQLQDAGAQQSRSTALTALEAQFPPDIEKGIAGAINRLWTSFSAWSATPNSAQARQGVLESASQFVDALRGTATQLSQISQDLDRQTGATIDGINNLTARIAELNADQLRSQANDPGRDANLHAALEELSSLADITVLTAADGTSTVLLEGQFPLVLGDRQMGLKLGKSDASGTPRVQTEQGVYITSHLRGGELGGLLSVKTGELASLLGSADDPGALDRLAKAVADRVNALLTSGNLSEGPPPVPGKPLFGYAQNPGSSVAASLCVNSEVTGSDLAASDPGPPWSANGIALRLAALSHSSAPEDQVDGLSYLEFFSTMAAKLGAASQTATRHKEAADDAVIQARNLRAQLSGVSLDAEAAHIVQLQRGYEACARVIQVIDELTDTLVKLGQ